MPAENFSVKTADNLELQGRYWAADNAIGQVALVHGFFEHVGRWPHVARALNEAGLSVWGLDLRGHGRSPGPRGDTPSYEHLLDDMDAFVEHVDAEHGPTLVYGHSFGGALVLHWMLKRQPRLAGAIATSPWLRLARPPNPLLRTFSRVAFKVAPHIRIKVAVREGVLSKDPSVHERYTKDPLVHRFMSPMTAESTIAAGEWSLANARLLGTPTLLAHGAEDDLTDPRASAAFARGAASEHLTYREEPGLRHEMHNEVEKDAFIASVVEYASARIKAAAS